MVVAAGIGSVLMTAVASLMYFSARSYAGLANYIDLDQRSRNALDRMSLEMRQADYLYSYATNQLVFINGGQTNLSYTFSPYFRTLVRTNGSTVETLLTECDSLVFTIYARATQSNAFNQFSTTNAANAKLVKVDWTCSRKILGNKANTESVESAKIVIRKQGS
jgi:Tfp pilus assembly protein PilW